MKITLSIVAGFVVWSLLWVAGNMVLVTAFPDAFDDNGLTDSATLLGAALALSIVLSVVSGWVAARLASGRESAAATILGVVLLVVGVAVQVGSWEAMPLWYHLSFLALLVPATVFGGRLAVRGGTATAAA